MEIRYFTIILFLCADFNVTNMVADADSESNVDAKWDTYLCVDENRLVDEKTIIITANGQKSAYLPCLALRKNLKVSGEYRVSSQLINTGSPDGAQNFGLAFNAEDIKNYDFAYLR